MSSAYDKAPISQNKYGIHHLEYLMMKSQIEVQEFSFAFVSVHRCHSTYIAPARRRTLNGSYLNGVYVCSVNDPRQQIHDAGIIQKKKKVGPQLVLTTLFDQKRRSPA